MKVVVTGASGLLGRAVHQELKNRNFDVIGLALQRAKEPLIRCDLTIIGEVEELILKIRPDFIVHAAVERSPFIVENSYEKAKDLNIESSRRLSRIANQSGSRIIFVSSDYVFDGKSPPYMIDAKTNPLNKYGITKLEGERAVLEENEDACVLRIPVLYGDVERIEESVVTAELTTLLAKNPTSIPHSEKRYPCYTKDVAKIICDLILKINQIPTVKGIFHWCGKECLTKYDIALSIGKAFDLHTGHLSADRSAPDGKSRPVDPKLDTSRLELLGISHHTPFSEAIKESLQSWVSSLKPKNI